MIYEKPFNYINMHLRKMSELIQQKKKKEKKLILHLKHDCNHE